MHLSKINNNAGATTEFSYESTPWYAGQPNTKAITTKSYPADGMPLITWYDNDNNGSHESQGWHYLNRYEFSYPGQAHWIECETQGSPSYQGILFIDYDQYSSFIDHKTGAISPTYPNLPDMSYQRVTGYLITNPSTAQSKINPGIATAQYTPNVHLSWCKFTPLVTRYRVTSKKSSDLISGSNYTYQYSYSGTADNYYNGPNDYNSWILNQSPRQTYPHSQYRGNAVTTIIDQERDLKTINYYYQDEARQGILWKSEIYKLSNSKLLSQSLSEYSNTNILGELNMAVCARDAQNFCYVDSIYYYDVHKIYDEERFFATSGSLFMGIKRLYEFDNIYGNVSGVTTYEWNGGAWVKKLFSKSGFKAPIDLANGIFLTGLPSYSADYACVNENCPLTSANLLRFSCTLYTPALNSPALCGVNSNGSVNEMIPANGLPKGSRTLLYFNNGNYSDPRYQDTTVSYDEWGNVTSQTSYSGEGSAGSLAWAVPNTTILVYDGVFHSRVTSQTATLSTSANAVTTNSYDSGGNCYWFGIPASVSDANGKVSTALCDEFGRLTEIRLPGDSAPNTPSTQIAYQRGSSNSPTALTVTAKLDEGKTSTTIYYANGWGKLVQTQLLNAYSENDNNYDLITSIRYDDLGREIQREVSPFKNLVSARGFLWRNPQDVIATTYDELGRVIFITNPNNTVTSTSYSVVNYGGGVALKTVTTPYGQNQPQESYSDAFGRLLEAGDGASFTAKYHYGALGSLTEVILPKDDVSVMTTSMSYDLAGRKLSLNDPNMGNWSYHYNAAGSLTEQLDARNTRTCLWYDASNRLTGKLYQIGGGACPSSPPANSQTTSNYAYFTYDNDVNAVGRMTAAYNQAAASFYQYSARGEIAKITLDPAIINSPNYEFNYTYYANGTPRTVTYPDGEVLTRFYNNHGQLERVHSSLSGNLLGGSSTPLYDTLGRLTELPLAGIRLSYQYFGAVTQGMMKLQNFDVRKTANGASLLHYGYSYYDSGEIHAINDTLGGTQTFTYDGLGRLTMAGAVDGAAPYSQTYSYNPFNGRMDEMKEGANPYPKTYGDASHPNAVTAFQGNNYSYDANGNMTSRVEDGVTYTQNWNAANMLRRVSWTENGTAHTVTFGYDAQGVRVLRIHKTVSAGVTHEITTVYMGGVYEEELDSSHSNYSDLFGALN